MRPRRAAAVRGQAVRAPQGALQVTPGIPTRADGCRGAGVFPHAGRGIARNVGGCVSVLNERFRLDQHAGRIQFEERLHDLWIELFPTLEANFGDGFF